MMDNSFFSLNTWLQITDLQSEDCVWTCERWWGLDNTHSCRSFPWKETLHTPKLPLPWKGNGRKSQTDRTVLQGVKTHSCFTSQSHLFLETVLPFPPLASHILTHHLLNKEVRAMIKSSHSVNQVARQKLDTALFRDTPLHQTCHLFSVISSLQLSVVRIHNLVGYICGIILPHLLLVTSNIFLATRLMARNYQ